MMDMQQIITKLTTQCSEKAFELELKLADNRVLQEQLLQKKKITLNNNSTKVDISSEKEVDCAQQETIDLKSKLQFKEAKIEKMKYEHLTREAALTENKLLEEEYKKKLDEANKELSLENDLAACEFLLLS
ncbi:hypothetical protein ZEAMMB73_Zm00001d019187 [Zea mays]|uniref:Uncharacterized protein n=1 Tax=Zea mays TaxID=4577 RepID=A0A1D6HW30_MAIZE|nr:hypothetical protein ZEAMMB73_Zm00001d019187 [Zea mays]